jgi:hypothetical protein
MIISPERSYIFVHVPKTGGTAMTSALEQQALPDDLVISDTPEGRRRRPLLRDLTPRGRLWKHSRLADIDGIVSPDQMATMLIFTLVRNPWDRMVSYYHWLKDQRFAHPAVGLAQTLAFPDFLRHPLIGASITAHPVRHYLTDATGREQPAHCLRIEHLAEDMAPVARHLGFVPVLPRVNASRRPSDIRSVYSDRDAALVARLCAEDIARFAYTFG